MLELKRTLDAEVIICGPSDSTRWLCGKLKLRYLNADDIYKWQKAILIQYLNFYNFVNVSFKRIFYRVCLLLY